MALYKRPGSKYWWMKFHFDGQLIQKSTCVANKRDAATVESAYRTQLALGKIGIKPKKTAPLFKDAVEDFLKWSEFHHAQKPKSFKRMSYSCQSIAEYFGKTRADRIEPKDIEKYLLWRSKQISQKTRLPITNTTINLELVALKTIFKRLVTSDFLAKNPAAGIRQLSENERRFHVLSEEEERLYLLACPQPLRDLATLVVETGMRPGEVCGLRRQHVRLEKGFLQVEDGKTKASNRKIWLSEKAKKVLRARLEKFKDDVLFPANDVDGANQFYNWSWHHRQTIDRLKFKFRLYDLRHTFATRVLESGIDLLTLASMLGHAGLGEVTRYAHPSEQRKSDAIKSLAKRSTKAV